MGRLQKKITAATSGSYVSRARALRKLQISLADFRRLCILKGIYPREPKNKRKLQNGSGALRTYYYTKDIQYLMHEPILQKFRDYKIFARKLAKFIGKREWTQAAKFEQNRPTYTLDHIVRERYPSFIDALRDLDDCLCMIFLFATLPKTNRVTSEISANCLKLAYQFQYYVARTNSLTKTFLSIKGIYYQAVICGQTITWLVPYEFAQAIPTDVDFRVMFSFLEFYQTMLGFVNFKLWSDLKLSYPPTVDQKLWDEDAMMDSLIVESTEPKHDAAVAVASYSEEGDVDGTKTGSAVAMDFPADVLQSEGIQANPMKALFANCTFYLSREVPRNSLEFIIKAGGGVVGWESGAGSPFGESSESITHQICDRPSLSNTFISRSYVQPQWVYDCVNAKKLLPIDDYKIGSTLPAHLSPFITESNPVLNEEEQERVLDAATIRKRHDEMMAEEDEENEEATMTAAEALAAKAKAKKAVNQTDKDKELAAERKQLAMSMMSKKDRKLYEQMQHGKRKKDVETQRLAQRKEALKKKKAKIA